MILKRITNNRGFTLVEIVVVLMIISISMMLVVPRFIAIFGNKSDQFKLFITYIAKTFDDSFLNDKTNFLIIHLAEPDTENIYDNEIFTRINSLSVVNLTDNKFVETKRKILKSKKFIDSFKIEEVLFPNKEKITRGYAMIPFYQHGYSENAIIHILVNDEYRMSVRIYKQRKEPEVLKEYITFEDKK